MSLSNPSANPAPRNAPDMEPLIASLLLGDKSAALDAVGHLLKAHVPRERIITAGIETAMNSLDEKCTIEQFNLLEIMLVGRALSAVVDLLYPVGSHPPTSKGTVVIASLQGDIHDIGKKIVIMVLSANGYQVIDCGKDCPVDKLISAAVDQGAKALLVSGLITSVIPQVRQIKKTLCAKGCATIKVLAGGAALKQASAAELEVDFVAQTAFDAFHYLQTLP